MNRSYTILALTIVLLLAALWQWRDSHQELAQTRQQLAKIEAHAQTLEGRILALETALADAKANSVEGVLEDANKELFEGWESLLNRFRQQLDSTREEIQRSLESETETDPSTEDEHT